MDAATTFTLQEAHLHFAKTTNGSTWELLEKPDRSAAQAELMLYAAFASAFHWLQVGTGLNHQRAEWLIARVYTVLGQPAPALQHATRCLELTRAHSGLMQDFDWAFAYEALARASALAGSREEALEYLRLATAAGEVIHDPEDKSIFQSDLAGGDWHGLR